MPLVEYIDMDAGAAEGKIPFVWSVDADKHLVKIAVGPGMVELVLDRRRNWRTLQFLSGRQVARMAAEHRNELEALQKRYQEEVSGHDASLDQIAQAMSELAASSGAPIATGLGALLTPFGGSTTVAAASAPAAAPAAGANGAGPIVTMDESQGSGLHQLQDLLPGCQRHLREDADRRRWPDERGRPHDPGRAR